MVHVRNFLSYLDTYMSKMWCVHGARDILLFQFQIFIRSETSRHAYEAILGQSYVLGPTKDIS